jgi:hypothetical protein
MTEMERELFVMVAKPKGMEASAIQLSQNIWKVEEELDMLYSSAKNVYETYVDVGESGAILKTDGTLVLSYPSEKECMQKFEEMKTKLAKTTVLPTIKYEKLELEKYKISKKVQGKLEDIASKELIAFLSGEKEQIRYDPRKISYEFADQTGGKNFVRIIFDKVLEEEGKLRLDVTVESNNVEYAKKAITQIESLLSK